MLLLPGHQAGERLAPPVPALGAVNETREQNAAPRWRRPLERVSGLLWAVLQLVVSGTGVVAEQPWASDLVRGPQCSPLHRRHRLAPPTHHAPAAKPCAMRKCTGVGHRCRL
eukprot:187106-Pyramimonas_sp.AAC.1